MIMLLLNDVFNPFLDNGFLRDILSALGLFLDFEVSDTYTLIYSIFLIIVALVFVVLSLRFLFRAFASIFKSVGL